jgi:predicted HicB family RNase H-like nuclease
MNLKYKGYVGSVDVDLEANLLFGKLLHIRDLVNYEAQNPADLKLAFEEAVDDYLDDCAEQGVEPDTPFKGQFNVRIAPKLHRELAFSARRDDRSLNDYVEYVLSHHEEVATAIMAKVIRLEGIVYQQSYRPAGQRVMQKARSAQTVVKFHSSFDDMGTKSNAKH